MDKLYSATQVSLTMIQLSGGRRIENVHEAEQCHPRNCPLHRPSDHAYQNLPLDFNGVNMLRLVDVDDENPTGSIIDPDDYSFNSNGYAILRNSAKCKLCDGEIQSNYRHDYKHCSCGEISVDGGYVYTRYGARNFENIIYTSVVVKKFNGEIIIGEFVDLDEISNPKAIADRPIAGIDGKIHFED